MAALRPTYPSGNAARRNATNAWRPGGRTRSHAGSVRVHSSRRRTRPPPGPSPTSAATAPHSRPTEDVVVAPEAVLVASKRSADRHSQRRRHACRAGNWDHHVLGAGLVPDNAMLHGDTMANAPDGIAFLAASETRLRIAEWSHAEPLSREQLAARLHRASGGLSAPDTMLAEAALVRAGYATEGTRGRRAELLKLNPKWVPALRAAQSLRVPGRLEAGVDLLLIPLGGQTLPAKPLREAYQTSRGECRLSSARDSASWLPHVRDDRGRSTIRVVAALETAGAHPMRIRLNAPMAPEDLRAWAASAVCPASIAELPSRGIASPHELTIELPVRLPFNASALLAYFAGTPRYAGVSRRSPARPTGGRCASAASQRCSP